ncbi:type IX secretion/gliding motility protein PorT/SprT [Ohtaekwangia sp.]|uniref:type IX secretion/gliding motility protein PorT/SprT n=1 Tax=Ohtaekwangia sp. TaxID=2066019 RepID=UPI003FA579E6
MQNTHFWNKLYLHRLQVVFTGILLLNCVAGHAQVKHRVQKNNPNYDDKKLTYGFLIGLHTSTYQLKYSDAFVTNKFDTVHSVVPSWSAGFSLGFIVNYRLDDQVDVRITPKVGFYEHRISYIYTDDTPRDDQLIESTMVELPILLKYKSERRGNVRMYMIGGIVPAFEASGKKKTEERVLEISNTNLSIDAGFGFDLYYPLFKFSPEIRFSRGLVNMLGSSTGKYGEPLKRINTNTITLYFLFQ